MARSERAADHQWRLERKQYRPVDAQKAELERARILLQRQRRQYRARRIAKFVLVVLATTILGALVAPSIIEVYRYVRP